MGCHWHCPYCVENRKGRANHRGHWGYVAPRRPRKEVSVGFLRKIQAERQGWKAGTGAGLSQEERERWPALCEFLTESVWPDGTPREVGSLTMFVEDGVTKVCVNDRDQGAVAFVAGPGLVEVLGRADDGLRAGTLDWRASRGHGKGRPGRK